MEKHSIHKYTFLGTSLRYLQDCENGWKIKSAKGDSGMYVFENIRLFLDELEDLNLFVTQRASGILESFYEKLKKKKHTDLLSSDEATKLSKIMTEIRSTFDAESKGIYAFITTEKRFTIDKLINSIDSLFTPGVFNKLSDIAIHDFQEAGYCIAFDRPTAAAFHILRGTEDVLRHFYKAFFRGKVGTKNWGQLTNELKNKSRGKKPDVIVINHLINIKNSFRNPTQHPDKIYDIHEAQDLLSLCIDIINRMSKKFKIKLLPTKPKLH